MAKKNKKDPGEIFQRWDPQIENLAMERLLSGKQLFNSSTKRLHKHIRDEAQARGILLRAQMLAQELGKELVLRSREKRLMQKIIKLIVFAFGFCLLVNLADSDNDGVADVVDTINGCVLPTLDEVR